MKYTGTDSRACATIREAAAACPASDLRWILCWAGSGARARQPAIYHGLLCSGYSSHAKETFADCGPGGSLSAYFTLGSAGRLGNRQEATPFQDGQQGKEYRSGPSELQWQQADALNTCNYPASTAGHTCRQRITGECRSRKAIFWLMGQKTGQNLRYYIPFSIRFYHILN
jgi:hypothetical protein